MCLLGTVLHGWKPLVKRGGHRLRGVRRLLLGTWGPGLWCPLQVAVKMRLLSAWPVPCPGPDWQGGGLGGASSHMRFCRSCQRGAGDQSPRLPQPAAGSAAAPAPAPSGPRLSLQVLMSLVRSRVLGPLSLQAPDAAVACVQSRCLGVALLPGHSAAGARTGTCPLGREWPS